MLAAWLSCAASVLPLSVLAQSQLSSFHRGTFTSSVKQLCQDWRSEKTIAAITGAIHQPVQTINVGHRHRFVFSDQSVIEFDIVNAGSRPAQFLGTAFDAAARPRLLMSLSATCDYRLARRIDYAADGRAHSIVALDAQLGEADRPQLLNPPVPEQSAKQQKQLQQNVASSASTSQQPLRVAMIDSGVNYLLPSINRRLARSDSGELIAYDFWDMDARPFDAHMARSAFFVQRHGTRTASLVLAEAPDIELVAYRYPRPDMTRMKALIEHADSNDVSIIGMPLGGNDADQWQVFSQVAAEYPHILFVASAGNNGRDIDQQPVYPAALTLSNLLVVSSADDFVKPAERTNWGAQSVDYLLPAELLAVTDYSGDQQLASGSSYAVSRLTAMAANIKSRSRHFGTDEIIAEINRHVLRLEDDWVAEGYIPDPLAVRPGARLVYKLVGEQGQQALNNESVAARLALDVLVLDANWTDERVSQLTEQAYAILAACEVARGRVTIKSVSAADHLTHISVGTAHTVLGGAVQNVLTVVLADDTRMQDPFEAEAFGLGNTRTRPWLRNSVWLTQSVQHEGIALAHEIMHILTNDGRHSDAAGNLMQASTSIDNTHLNNTQCQRALSYGLQSGLLEAI